MLIVPLVWASLVFPDLFGSIALAPKDAGFMSILFGFLWGIGGILFGVSVRYVDVSYRNGPRCPHGSADPTSALTGYRRQSSPLIAHSYQSSKSLSHIWNRLRRLAALEPRLLRVAQLLQKPKNEYTQSKSV